MKVPMHMLNPFRTNKKAGGFLIFSCALMGIALLLPIAIHAQIENPLGSGSTFQTIVERFTKLAQILVTPLSVLMILIAGFMYMTAGGNEERLKTAHKMLIWAIIGIALVLLATAAQAIIRSVLGA